MKNMSLKFSGLVTKRIPTLVGVGLLVVALILSTIFFQQGLGVFSPRATPESTPKQVRITNLTESSFTISFLTEGEVSGAVKFGTEENALKQTATDHRDGLSGTIGKYKLHYINVRGLQPNTTYYYVLNTNGGTLFDNNGAPFKVITARKSGSPIAAKTIYGTVSSESGAPAEGAVVYIAIDGAGEMSSLVASSGSWAIPLSNARTVDGAEYAKVDDDTTLQVFVQGDTATEIARGTTTVADAQPIPALVFGQTAIVSNTEALQAESATATREDEIAVETPEESMVMTDTSSESAMVTPVETPSSSTSSQLADSSIASDSSTSAEVTEFDLTTETQTKPTLTTTQPTFSGTAAPNATVTIEIHSDTQINHQLIANADGTFSLNIAELSKELEPGEHTITYSYTDANGQPQTKTETFYVEPQSTSSTLAQATTATPSPTPFGTDNPYPINGSTTSASVTSSSSASSSSSSGRVSNPSTASGMPVTGSVGTTMALIFGGMFFIISGAWSYWASKQYAEERA